MKSMLGRMAVSFLFVMYLFVAAGAYPLGSTRDYRDSPFPVGYEPSMMFNHTPQFVGGHIVCVNDDEGLDIYEPIATGFDYVDSVYLGVEPADLTARGDVLAVGTEESGLRLYDVSDLESPTPLATFFDGSGVWATAWMGSRLAVALEDSFAVCSTDPPGVDARLDLPADADRLAYDRERHLVYTASSDGLGVIDVSTPSLPVLRHQLDDYLYISDVAVVPTTTYVLMLAGSAGLVPVDVDDPDAPVALTPVSLQGTPEFCELQGDLLWIGSDEGLEVFDVSDPAAPAPLDRLVMYDAPYRMALAGNHLVYELGYEKHLISLGDVTAVPDTLVVGLAQATRGRVSGAGYVDLEFDGDYIYAVDLDGEFEVLKPQPGNSEAVLALGGTGLGLVRSGDRIFAALAGGQFAEIDISTPTSPVHSGGYNLSDDIYDLCVDGDVCWLANGADGLVGMEVGTAGNPVPGVSHDPGAYTVSVAAGQDLVVAALSNGTGLVYDAADVHAGSVGSFGTEGTAVAMTFYENRLHVVTDDAHYLIVDLRDPTLPEVVGYYEGRDRYFHDIAIHDDVAYVAAARDGVWAVDVSDHSAPMPIGRLPVADYAAGLTVGGYTGFLGELAASEDEGIVIGPLHAADPNVSAETPAAARLAPASPNPFNPRTTFRFDLARATDIDFAVFDLRGRRVATLARGVRDAGAHVLDWDGRDAAGTVCAAGVYVAVLDAEGERRSRKVSLVK